MKANAHLHTVLSASPEGALGTSYLRKQRIRIRRQYDQVAEWRMERAAKGNYYQDQLLNIFKFVVEPDSRVLQIRSDTGALLHGLQPTFGVGTDVSSKLVSSAAKRYPHLHFLLQEPDELSVKGEFDYVIVNSANDVVDLEATFLNVRRVSSSNTRVLVLGYNYLWRPLSRTAEVLGVKPPQPAPNWFSTQDVKQLLLLAGFESIRIYGLFLLPLYIPLISALANKIFARLPLLRRLTFLYLVVARRSPEGTLKDHSVSVVIPCKNERGNIEAAVNRVPAMGAGTELVFCDDKSTDGTADEVRRLQEAFPDKNITLVEGPGICKAQNVWTGFSAAQGEILMILDADLTVLPEELPFFYRALVEGKGEFINGSRLVYPMQTEAMRGLNVLGNTLFSWAFTFLLGQRIKDTLCGTKVLFRRDYERIKRYRGSWGIDDRWGDYELLFGAARLHMKIVDLPVHYVERIYGETKMRNRFKNAVVMLRMCIAALSRLKFV